MPGSGDMAVTDINISPAFMELLGSQDNETSNERTVDKGT